MYKITFKLEWESPDGNIEELNGTQTNNDISKAVEQTIEVLGSFERYIEKGQVRAEMVLKD